MKKKKHSVLKIGGSVLCSSADYKNAARYVRQELFKSSGCKLIVVVSAESGETDQLLADALSVCSVPEQQHLDLLWSVGEIRSVARLALCLSHLGVQTIGLAAHQTGLFTGKLPGQLLFDRSPIEDASSRADVVVVPGFFAIGDRWNLSSLGRGASDLSAVTIACGLGLDRCTLVKDVSGYFDCDPAEFKDAQHLPSLSYRGALELARNGCELVHDSALHRAAEDKLRLIIRSLDDTHRSTLVGGTVSNELERKIA